MAMKVRCAGLKLGLWSPIVTTLWSFELPLEIVLKHTSAVAINATTRCVIVFSSTCGHAYNVTVYITQ